MEKFYSTKKNLLGIIIFGIVVLIYSVFIVQGMDNITWYAFDDLSRLKQSLLILSPVAYYISINDAITLIFKIPLLSIDSEKIIYRSDIFSTTIPLKNIFKCDLVQETNSPVWPWGNSFQLEKIEIQYCVGENQKMCEIYSKGFNGNVIEIVDLINKNRSALEVDKN